MSALSFREIISSRKNIWRWFKRYQNMICDVALRCLDLVDCAVKLLGPALLCLACTLYSLVAYTWAYIISPNLDYPPVAR